MKSFLEIKFLAQGFSPESDNTVGLELIRLLNDRHYHSFTWFSAFASEAGINGLSAHIDSAKANFKALTIIIGIDQKGTSQEALEAILGLKVNSFVFYQPSFSIFHPKIYLFEGEEFSSIIIGSSNLTAQGLFTNIEASVLIKFNMKEGEGSNVLATLKNYFHGIFELSDPNLRRLTPDLIAQLIEAKIVPTEQERQEQQDKYEKNDSNSTSSLIDTLFPKRVLSKIPPEFSKKKRAEDPKKQEATNITSSFNAESLKTRKLVWSKRQMSASDAQYSKAGTNPTGGLRLVQSGFEVNEKVIDQTTYFRNELFGSYTWEKQSDEPFVEVAVVPFELVIDEEYIGQYHLEVRHKPQGEANQGNYTTLISWGQIGKIIRDANLTGAQLDLYAPKNPDAPFTIVIFQKHT